MIHLKSVEVEIESDRCFPVSVIVTSVIQQSMPRMNRSVSVTYKESWKVANGFMVMNSQTVSKKRGGSQDSGSSVLLAWLLNSVWFNKIIRRTTVSLILISIIPQLLLIIVTHFYSLASTGSCQHICVCHSLLRLSVLRLESSILPLSQKSSSENFSSRPVRAAWAAFPRLITNAPRTE